MLDAVLAGQGRIAVVLGEAGAGKTRIAGEIAGLALARDARILAGRGYESARILPFGPWVEAVRGGDVLTDMPGLDGLNEGLRGELGRLFPELAGRRTPGAPGPENDLRLFEALVQIFIVLAAGRPLVLVLEDLHWADEMSLRLLSFFVRRIALLPVLVVATVREEEVADAPALSRTLEELSREPTTVQITLARLSREATADLVRRLVRTGREALVTRQLEEQVWRASEGNPFMVVETVRALGEGTTLGSGPLPLPDRVRQVIAGRLERLSARGRELAAVAAVIGREFEFALLVRAAQVTEREAAEGLEELVRRRVLNGVGERFDFTHDNIREVAASQILHTRRRLLHAAVAKGLEDLYADTLQSHAAVLGLHYCEAFVWDKAVVYLRQAAQSAVRAAHYRHALTLFERALGALAHLPGSGEAAGQAIDLRLDLLGALTPLGEMARLVEYLRDAEALAETAGDRRRLGRVWAQMTFCHWWMGNPDLAAESGERARALAAALDDVPLEVLTNYHLGQTYFHLGQYHRAIEVCARNAEVIRGELAREGFSLPVLPAVYCRTYLGLGQAALGDFVSAGAHEEEAARAAELADHAFSRAFAHWGIGLVALDQGNVDAAIVSLERSLDLCRAGEFTSLFPVIVGPLGRAYTLSGRVAEGLALLEGAVKRSGSMKIMVVHRRNVAYLGEAHLLAGDLADAMRHADDALALSRTQKQRGGEAEALRLLGDIHSSQRAPDVERARASYEQALSLAQGLGMRPLVAHCHLGLGELFAKIGEPLPARAGLTAAAALYRAMEMSFWSSRAETRLATLIQPR